MMPTTSALVFEPLWQHLLPAAVLAAVVVAAFLAGIWILQRWLRRWGPRPESGRLGRNLLTVVALLVAALILARGAARSLPPITFRELSDWTAGPGLHILLIFTGAFVLARITDFFIAHLQRVLAAPEIEPRDWAERRKRIETVGRLLRGLASLVIVAIAGMMALREVNVDTTPILTGAGVIGVSVGLAGQTVVRDMIVGIFLILESQIRVGDVVSINGKTGLVEALKLRIIVLRGDDGSVHIFHNGSVNEYTNLTKDYSCAMLDLSLPFEEDLARVQTVLEGIGAELAADPDFHARLQGKLEVLGLQSLNGTSVVVRLRQRTVPMEQWAVDRELRRRIQLRFQRERIALA